MSFFNNYPYTDFHELNLDWFLTHFHEFMEEWKSMKDSYNSIEEMIQDFKDFFKNLNVQDEINNKIDEMLADGSLEGILCNYCDYKYNILGSLKENALYYSDNGNNSGLFVFDNHLSVISYDNGLIIANHNITNIRAAHIYDNMIYLLKTDGITIEVRDVNTFEVVNTISLQYGVQDFIYIDGVLYSAANTFIYKSINQDIIKTIDCDTIKLFNYGTFIGAITTNSHANDIILIGTSGAIIHNANIPDYYLVAGAGYYNGEIIIALVSTGTICITGTITGNAKGYNYPVTRNYITQEIHTSIYINGAYVGFKYDGTVVHPLSCICNMDILYDGSAVHDIHVANCDDQNITILGCDYILNFIGWDGSADTSPKMTSIQGAGARDCKQVWFDHITFTGASTLYPSAAVTGFATGYILLKDCKIAPVTKLEKGCYMVGSTSLSINGLEIADSFTQYTFDILEGASLAISQVVYTGDAITPSRLYGVNQISGADIETIKHDASHTTLSKTFRPAANVTIDLLTLESNGVYDVSGRTIVNGPVLTSGESIPIVIVNVCSINNKVIMACTNKDNVYFGIKIGSDDINWVKVN